MESKNWLFKILTLLFLEIFLKFTLFIQIAHLWSVIASSYSPLPFPFSFLRYVSDFLTIVSCNVLLQHIFSIGRMSIFVCQFQFSLSVVSDSLWSHGLQHARLPCLSLTPGACSNSCPSSWWCHPTISPSVIPFSFHLHSFLASGSSTMSQFFASGGQSIGVSASTSVLPINIQDWFPLGLTVLISLQSKGLSRVFSNTTVHKDQFVHAQLSL